ncbi:hypothetical protein KSC_057310 [Ktedonobacter sp. SOSP1-52]|uniref:hypothetical protein n=1 Tax=Ktedonobacter sp. SOSP1-52 TaxID=2778366 RepID=UPI0019169229|nr:hypothetical protein [Ktedonobacter sp. SOSP1-52]GHO66839.1 hypothetical protein KSC_057310 [Ktedonobacter sp. SOSP1-52]
MSSTSLQRLSGIGLLIGSVLAIAGGILGIFSSNPASSIAIVGSLTQFIGATLVILGLPGMYARQAQRAGILGLVGTALMICYILILGTFGSALNAVLLPFIATHAPALAQSEPPGLGIFFMVGGLLGALGGISLGLATIRASILPRWTGVLLMGSVIQVVGDFFQSPIANLGFMLVMIGFAWL